jgi:hypothetical protein
MPRLERVRNARIVSRRLLRAGPDAGTLVTAGRGPWSALAAQDDLVPDGYAHPELPITTGSNP